MCARLVRILRAFLCKEFHRRVSGPCFCAFRCCRTCGVLREHKQAGCSATYSPIIQYSPTQEPARIHRLHHPQAGHIPGPDSGMCMQLRSQTRFREWLQKLISIPARNDCQSIGHCTLLCSCWRLHCSHGASQNQDIAITIHPTECSKLSGLLKNSAECY